MLKSIDINSPNSYLEYKHSSTYSVLINRLTHVQAITTDIETLIVATVDPKVADYAVITGVQIHSGAQVLDSLHDMQRAGIEKVT